MATIEEVQAELARRQGVTSQQVQAEIVRRSQPQEARQLQLAQLQDLLVRQGQGEQGLQEQISQLRASAGVETDPALGIDPRIGVPSAFPEERGATLAAAELPETGQGGLLAGEDQALVAALAPALLTTTRNDELAQIITANFPNIGMQTSPAGEIILANNKTGAKVIVNRPGLSRLDLIQGLGIGSAFMPSGRLAAAAPSLLGRVGTGAITSAATQAGIEGAQELAGGRIDEQDIAISGLFGGLAEVAQPILQGASTRIRDFIRAAPDEEAAQIIAAGERTGVPVMTTDVVPPQTFFGRAIRDFGEKIGIFGTGGKRAAQQEARKDTVQAIADEFNITSVNDDFLPEIIKSLSKKQSQELGEAAALRNSAVDRLAPLGDVQANNAFRAIDRELANQARLGAKANQDLVRNLEATKEALKGDFRLFKDVRTEVISDLKAIARGEDTRALGAMQKVKSAIDKDMIIFARKHDKAALKDWLKSNRAFAFELSKAKNTELKRLIQKGDASPKTVAPILRGGDPTELKRLSSSLTEKGRANARSAIIRDALENSRFFSEANPDSFATQLAKPKTQRAINVFFNESQKKQLNGLRKLLDSTRRAQQASVTTPTGQALLAPGAAVGAVVDPLTTTLVVAPMSGITRAYESKAMRSFLLKLASAKKGSKQELELLRQAQPAISSAIQALQQSQTTEQAREEE